MNKNPLIEKLLSESIDEKINQLTSKLEDKVNIMEIDAHDLEYEESYELDNPKGKPRRVIFKGRGRKGRGDTATQTYHFEDDKGHDFMLSGNGVKSKIKKTDSDMKKENEEFTEGNAFTKKLKDTQKGGKFKIGDKTYTDKSELEEKLYGGQKKLDKNNNGKIDAEDFKMLKKGKKTETDEQWQALAEPAIAAATTWALDKFAENNEGVEMDYKTPMEEEMGGMEDSHPRFGKMNFSKMSKDNILNLLTKRLKDDEEEEEEEEDEFSNSEERLEEAKKFIQNAMNKVEKKNVKNESVTYRLKLTEDTQIDMDENELVDFIEELVIEAKNNDKLSGTPKGMAEYKRVSKIEKKQNNDAMGEVKKKMRDYLKEGSKGQFEMNPKHFPKGNGYLAKMKKQAYMPSDTTKEYVENFPPKVLKPLLHKCKDGKIVDIRGVSKDYPKMDDNHLINNQSS